MKQGKENASSRDAGILKMGQDATTTTVSGTADAGFDAWGRARGQGPGQARMRPLGPAMPATAESSADLRHTAT